MQSQTRFLICKSCKRKLYPEDLIPEIGINVLTGKLEIIRVICFYCGDTLKEKSFEKTEVNGGWSC